ncbi:MAG: hypothetical protein F4039_09005 [Gammaproteobacteria bacterium]|nr:hypothetical protein [Gammaproteobacteria bacterium]MYK44208.1 hypothetical protein [Gammaproteobacteria bacterium]
MYILRGNKRDNGIKYSLFNCDTKESIVLKIDNSNRITTKNNVGSDVVLYESESKVEVVDKFKEAIESVKTKHAFVDCSDFENLVVTDDDETVDPDDNTDESETDETGDTTTDDA